MTAVIHENYLSREFQLGNTRQRTRIYDIIGTEDEEAVRILVNATIPTVYLGLVLDGYTVKPLGGDLAGVWNAVVTYDRLEDDNEYTFNTGGGTRKVTNSLTTISAYAPSGHTPPNFQGAIGVTEDKVEGVDVTTPVFEFTETHLFDDAIVSTGYKRVLFDMTGRVNNANFKGCTVGECLFRGASGTRRGDSRWSITFTFAGSPSYTGASIGSISGVAKLGWDYLWVRYADFEDGTAVSLVKRPVSAYVERVYEFGDFSTLLIGTV